jgi:hypothetical protein
MRPSFLTHIAPSVLPSRTTLGLMGVAAAAILGCGSGSSGLFGAGGTAGSGSGSGTASATGPSGSSGSGGNGTSSSGMTGTSSSGTTGTGGSGGSSTTTASGTGGAPTTTSGTGGTPACPKETGAYTVTDVGQGCGDLDITASECIKETPNGCQVLLVSKAGVTGRAVDGTVGLDANGDFTGGMLKLGSTARTGCTGTWKPGPPRELVVDCGGMASSQSCTVTLTHVGDTCSF